MPYSSNADNEYKNLLTLVLEKGKRKKNRTGVDTLGVFGAQARFDLSHGFPLLTTKKMAVKAITHELLWFISGSTNIKYLVDNGCNIWNANAYDRYQKTPIFALGSGNYFEIGGDPSSMEGQEVRPFTLNEFVLKIKDDPKFAAKWGDLGEGTYGGMWRAFPYAQLPERGTCYAGAGIGHVDQLTKVIEKLKSSPDDRRLIVSAWHPHWVDHCVLPPCHVMYHFNTEELSHDERMAYAYDVRGLSTDIIPHDYEEQWLLEQNIPTRRLNCLLYQRSCDLFLGVPFNIASYALLTSMVAQVVNMVPGEFIHTFGDLHIYENHIDQCVEQLKRTPYDSPSLVLNRDIKTITGFKIDDIKIENYNSHPALKAEMAV